MKRKATLAVLGLVLGACGSCEQPARTADVDELQVEVPQGWTTELSRKGPIEQLALRPPGATVLCRVVVMRGESGMHAPTAERFVETSRERFGGEEHAQGSLDTGLGEVPGHFLRDVKMPQELGSMGGDARIELYATDHGDAMVGAIIGWFRGETEDQRQRDACFDALETLAPAD